MSFNTVYCRIIFTIVSLGYIDKYNNILFNF